jgi:hypothetical protein
MIISIHNTNIQSRNQAVSLIKETGKKYLYAKHISANSLEFKNSDNNLLYQKLPPFLALTQAKL